MDKLHLHKCSNSISDENSHKFQFHNLWSSVNSKKPFTTTTKKNVGKKFKKNGEISDDGHEEKGKFFSDLNEKLFRHSNNRMSRSSRRSLCKSTISSHDSGISVVEDYYNLSNSDHGNRSNRNSVHLLSITSVEEQISRPATASEICCSKQLSKSCNIQQALAENSTSKSLITDHCGVPRKSDEQDYTETLRRSAQRNREVSARLLPKLNRSRNSLSGYPKPVTIDPVVRKDSFTDETLEDSSASSSVLQSSSHEDNASSVTKHEVSFSDHLQRNFETCSNVGSQTSRTDSFSTSIDSPRNFEKMPQVFDQISKNAQQRKRANIAAVFRDMEGQRQGDFGDFFDSGVENENLATKFTTDEDSREVSTVEETAHQQLKLENYSLEPSSSSTNIESSLYATVNKNISSSNTVPHLQTEEPDITSDMKSALPPPLPRKPPPVLPPKTYSRQNVHLSNDRFILPTNVPNPGHNFCSNCIHICQNGAGQLPKNCSAGHNGGHRCHCYSTVNKRPVVPVHPYFTKNNHLDVSGRDSPTSPIDQEEFYLRLKLNLDDEDEEQDGDSLKTRFLTTDQKRSEKITTPSVLLSPTVFELRPTKPLSPKPPVPPKPVRGQLTPMQGAQPPELPPKRTITEGKNDVPTYQIINHAPTADHSPISRRNLAPVGGPKFRDQPKLNAALNDDHSTIRRSRLVAEKSNDSDLYDLLLNQQRRSVDYFGAVLSSSSKMVENQLDDLNSNRNNRLDDIDEAKISTFTDYSNNNYSQKKNVDSINAKNNNNNDDHRRLSIGSDKSVNLDDEKKELIVSLTNKLDVLREALADVEDESAYNEKLGTKIADIVRNCDYLSQNDKDLYRLHVQDVDKITHLLLKLSGQLARVDNELNGVQVASSVMDKEKLLERKNRLTEQLNDAASLKLDIDERGRKLTKILEKCSNPILFEECNGKGADDVVDDYLYFMQMKTQLLLDATEIRDKIKLGETQRQALIDSLG